MWQKLTKRAKIHYSIYNLLITTTVTRNMIKVLNVLMRSSRKTTNFYSNVRTGVSLRSSTPSAILKSHLTWREKFSFGRLIWWSKSLTLLSASESSWPTEYPQISKNIQWLLFITSTLKSLAMRAIWLALSCVIYS